MGSKIIGRDAVFYWDTPLPPNFQVLSDAQVKQSNPSGAGESSWEEIQWRPARHELEYSWEAFRRASMEGSLLLTVAGSLNAERIWMGGIGGREHELAGKDNGGGGLGGL